MGFYVSENMMEKLRMTGHDGLSEEGSAFCAAYIEDVGNGSNIANFYVGGCGKSVSEPCSVDV